MGYRTGRGNTEKHSSPTSATWEYQNSTLDQSGWTVTATVQHFSIYAVLQDTDPPVPDPPDGSAGVDISRVISVTFGENIQAGDSFSGITLKDSGNNTVTINNSINGSVLTISPVYDLDYNQTYHTF